MDQKFTVSTGWKLFYTLLALAMIGFSLFLFTIHTSASKAVFILPVFVLALAIAIIIGVFKRAVIIYDDRIVRVNLFKTTSIYTADIKGVRISDKVITIEPKEGSGASKLTISNYSDYADLLQLTGWLRSNFTDLNQVDYQAELDDILADQNLGLTEDDRKEQLNKAKYISLAYNIAGVAILFAGVFTNSSLFTIVLLAYPLISILIINTSKGLIRFFSKKESPYYNIMVGVQMSATGLLARALHSNILQYHNFWIPFFLVILTFSALLYFSDPNKSALNQGGFIFIILLISGIYSFGAVIEVNCCYDHSAESTFHSIVIDHRISQGKHTSYYLTLNPWGPVLNNNEVSVSSYRYNQSIPGSSVSIHLKKGLLNIPWYTISD